MTKGEHTGTWFPTGFHGHFRSKSRLDFINEYRLLAKPQPPKAFLRRSQSRASEHQFSHHDNRNSFMNDALYFEQGLGRRRIANSSTRYHPDLLAWAVSKVHIPVPPSEPPVTSVYRGDFRGPAQQSVKQHFVSRPKTSFDESMPMTTTYRYAHGRDNPNKDLLNVMSNRGLSPRPPCRQRAVSAQACRESVASCMSWIVKPRKSMSITPASTVPIIKLPGGAPADLQVKSSLSTIAYPQAPEPHAIVQQPVGE